MGKNEISPLFKQGAEHFVTRFGLNPNVVLSRQGSVCATVEDDTAFLEIHFGFLVV